MTIISVIKIFLIIILALFIIGFAAPLVILRSKGKNAYGVHGNFQILERLTPIFFAFWGVNIITYVFITRIYEFLWFFSIFISDLCIIFGFCLSSLGLIIYIIGIWKLGINFRIELPEEETQLITTGMYSIIRNPIALGLYVWLIGTFFLIPSMLSLILVIVNIIAFDSKVRSEEKFLKERFGEEYNKYLARVGRYFPIKLRTGEIK